MFDYRVPGVTSMSADTHKYGYAFKGSSVLTFRDRRRCATRSTSILTDWSGGKYTLPRHGGLALRRAASRPPGRPWCSWATTGYLRYARQIFETSVADAGGGAARTRSCGSSGKPTFLFYFTSDEFDIYHVNDFIADGGGGSTGSSTRTHCTWR